MKVRHGIWVVVAALSMAAGCKKTPPPPAGGEAGLTAEQEQIAKGLAALMGAAATQESGPRFVPGPMKENVEVPELGIRLNHPDNVALKVEGGTVTLTAEGILPAVITAEKLTPENAIVKVEVNGVTTLGTGRSGGGTDITIQTDCLLIRCRLTVPDGMYESWKSEVGEAICASVDALPPPTVPAVTTVTNSRSTGGASCPEGYSSKADPFVNAVDTPEIREAYGKCWTDAVAANPAWKGATPRFSIGFDRDREPADAPWRLDGELSSLDGDTAAFLQCLMAASKALEANCPSEFPPEGCSLLGYAYVKFGEVVRCP